MTSNWPCAAHRAEASSTNSATLSQSPTEDVTRLSQNSAKIVSNVVLKFDQSCLQVVPKLYQSCFQVLSKLFQSYRSFDKGSGHQVPASEVVTSQCPPPAS